MAAMNEIDYSLSVDALPAEAWVPKVGDRVRVLSRPECHYCREHGEEEVGLTGRIDAVLPCSKAVLPCSQPPGHGSGGCCTHPVWVEFDDVGPDGKWSHFAAIELERLP